MERRYREKKRRFRLGRFLLLVLVLLVIVTGFGNCHRRIEETWESIGLDNSCFYKGEEGYRHYDDGRIVSLEGIDVSAHQGYIDWNAVAEYGVDFAFIRCGYRDANGGTICGDSYFKYNIKEAARAGLDTGVYFFSQAISVSEAEEEARFVKRQLRGHTVTYPIAYDMEELGKRTSNLSMEERTAIAKAFCEELEDAGYTCIIYGNLDWFRNYVYTSELEDDYNIWLARYSETPGYDGNISFWQYSDKGNIPGIEKPVDLDLCFVEK